VGGERVAARYRLLVLDDKEAARRVLAREAVELLPGGRLDFRDPFGNRVQVVQYDQIQFLKACHRPAANGPRLPHQDRVSDRRTAVKRPRLTITAAIIGFALGRLPRPLLAQGSTRSPVRHMLVTCGDAALDAWPPRSDTPRVVEPAVLVVAVAGVGVIRPRWSSLVVALVPAGLTCLWLILQEDVPGEDVGSSDMVWYVAVSGLVGAAFLPVCAVGVIAGRALRGRRARAMR
jgi:hypothetical protein